MISIPWIAFVVLVLGLLALDLFVFNRKAHVIGMKESLGWTAFWVALGLLFMIPVYFGYEYNWFGMGAAPGYELDGKNATLEYLTAYLVEKSLSLDNIFVIALIFSFYRVPPQYQHRVLFWGIVGAQVMRGIMIAAGTILIHKFDWTIYVFGVLLLLTSVKLLFSSEENFNPDSNWLIRLARRFFPVTSEYEGERFFTIKDGKRAATPMFLVLLLIESTDLMFAVDSIPAVFAVTRDPFIVFTSNIFAILGLRSLYFALAGMMAMFHYLKYSLVVLLAYVGVKMLLSHHYPVPTLVSLGIICGILTTGILVSVILSKRQAHQTEK